MSRYLTVDEYLAKDFIRNPTLVAKMLSSSTWHIDQREKSLNSHRAASIEEYVMLSQTDRLAFLHRRDARAVKLELKGEIQELRCEFRDQKSELRIVKWMVGIVIAWLVAARMLPFLVRLP